MLASFLCGEFLLHIPYWLYFIGGVSLTHPVLASFFNLGSLSYISRAGFFFFLFIWGVFLKPPMLASFFYLGSFSGMQSSLKTTPKEKSWMEDGPEKKEKKKRGKSHAQNREGTLQHPIQSRTNPNKN